MSKSSADLILHPIRMRIIQALVGGARRTRQQISDILTDVPQATMYRHLNMLHKANLIEVVERKPIRGTIEKVYALAKHGADISQHDLKTMNSTDHMELFMKFVGHLIGEYGRYLGQDGYDLVKDGVSFREIELYLSDEEYMQLLQDMRALLTKHVGNEPSGERRRRAIATIVIPGAKPDQHRADLQEEMDEE
ncbi:helix-turn-helix domain-containing protein [Paenibacillus cremeus]|uniref:helix-turn-helix domain-containing protein n=1 Tax=Paenibacillus cremeus TaxID=2163881 RepID=UPI001647E48F|nr:helix-turn-helix domain-containing protein [Paenibacillus cremeus]